MTPTSRSDTWPALPLEAWRDTYATLHMWMQVVGKVCLALTPRSNHFWNIAFQVTSRGLITPTLTAGDRAITIAFDFISHQLLIQCSDGGLETIALEPRTVGDFYAAVMRAMHRMGVDVHIWTMPVEVPNPIRFETDTVHRSYDPAYANAHWRALVAMKPAFENFRCRFVGKCSPVHFFWGSFDLAVTRFSGRRAPARSGADAITREAYSHEVISHGFWAGSGAIAEPAFYAYAAPEPAGLKTTAVLPQEAYYSTELSIFILPYGVVRVAPSPEKVLTQFVESTYDAAAKLAAWNRAELERS
jgi:hypothetical protein